MTAPSSALQWLAMKMAPPCSFMNRSRWLTDSLAKLFRPGKSSVFCRIARVRRQGLALDHWLRSEVVVAVKLERYVSVLARRAFDCFAQTELEAPHQGAPGLARLVDEGDDRDPERVAEPDEAGCLDRGVDVDGARKVLWLVADDADDVAAEPAKSDHYVLGEEGLHLEEFTVVEDASHQLAHVVRLVRRLGHDGLELWVRALAVVSGGDEGRTLVVAGRQVGQQAPHARGAFILRARQEVSHA